MADEILEEVSCGSDAKDISAPEVHVEDDEVVEDDQDSWGRQ